MAKLQRDFNPFSNIDLHLPASMMDAVREFCRTQGAEREGQFESVPFNRIVDVWCLASAIGFANKLFIALDRAEQHKFHTGQVLQGATDRIETLLLMAIAHSGDPFVVKDPKKVIEIADSYAFGGLPVILEALHGGRMAPGTNMMRELLKQLPTAIAT